MFSLIVWRLLFHCVLQCKCLPKLFGLCDCKTILAFSTLTHTFLIKYFFPLVTFLCIFLRIYPLYRYKRLFPDDTCWPTGGWCSASFAKLPPSCTKSTLYQQFICSSFPPLDFFRQMMSLRWTFQCAAWLGKLKVVIIELTLKPWGKSDI